MNPRRLHLSRVSALLVCLGALVLSACGTNGPQFDPAGQNSGSAQNAPGAFNFDDPQAKIGGVGQTFGIYDIYTNVTTAITLTSVSTSTTPANQNAGEKYTQSDQHFLIVNFTLKNTTDGSTKPCPTKCVEYLSPLSNFRLLDSQGRQWPSTTGAVEPCSADPQGATCNNRLWLNIAQNGLAPNATFTNRLAFVVPTTEHSFIFAFAPYRFPDTTPNVTSGPVSAAAPSVSRAATPAPTAAPPAPTEIPAPILNNPTLAEYEFGA